MVEKGRELMTNVSLENRSEAAKLRQAGLTYREIGKKLGITGERVRQLLKGKSKVKKPELNSKVLLRPCEAAKLLGINVSTIRRWSATGILRSYRITPRGDRRFQREDIDNFLASKMVDRFG